MRLFVAFMSRIFEVAQLRPPVHDDDVPWTHVAMDPSTLVKHTHLWRAVSGGYDDSIKHVPSAMRARDEKNRETVHTRRSV